MSTLPGSSQRQGSQRVYEQRQNRTLDRVALCLMVVSVTNTTSCRLIRDFEQEAKIDAMNTDELNYREKLPYTTSQDR